MVKKWKNCVCDDGYCCGYFVSSKALYCSIKSVCVWAELKFHQRPKDWKQNERGEQVNRKKTRIHTVIYIGCFVLRIYRDSLFMSCCSDRTNNMETLLFGRNDISVSIKYNSQSFCINKNYCTPFPREKLRMRANEEVWCGVPKKPKRTIVRGRENCICECEIAAQHWKHARLRVREKSSRKKRHNKTKQKNFMYTTIIKDARA